MNDEICYSYIDGSEYDCRRRCPSQDYSKDWDIIGTFDCANKEHVAAFENAKQAYLQFKSLQQQKLEAMTNVQYLDTFGLELPMPLLVLVIMALLGHWSIILCCIIQPQVESESQMMESE